MSESKIRRLFNDELIDKLTDRYTGKLKFQFVRNGTQHIAVITDDYIVGHLIPAPSDSETLGGDHIRYTGIYQMTLRASNDVDEDGDGEVDYLEWDMDVKMDKMVDTIRDIFKNNMRLTDASGFTVQVVSPLKVTEARMVKDDPWWTVQAYFNYRADTN